MQLSSKIFVMLSLVVGSVLIAAEPCANAYEYYDMTACNFCAENENGQSVAAEIAAATAIEAATTATAATTTAAAKAAAVTATTAVAKAAAAAQSTATYSICCNAIYCHSLGRDDDDFADGNDLGLCSPLQKKCGPGANNCYPGLICVRDNIHYRGMGTCQLPTDNLEAHAAASLVTSSSSTSNTTTGGPSFVLVVVGLLDAAIIAMTVVLQRRHRGLLRRHQYNAVDATPIAV